MGYVNKNWIQTQFRNFSDRITAVFAKKTDVPAASDSTPKANGTAAVGTEAAFARGDHVHPAQTTVSGNAGSATKLATARTIDGVNFNGSAAITHYGTCSTAAATAAKLVAITGFVLATGAVARVKFTITNTAANPTLNVNNTGAKAIYYRGAAISASYLAANRTYEFVYNGTQWDLVGDINVNTKYSNMTGATASAAGKAGLVPAPAAGAQAKYLCGDGTWQELPDSIYQRHDALSDGTPIVTNSTDWNTLISPGSYKITSGSTIADGINAPTGEYGNGLMFVIRNIDSNNQSYIFQLYFPTVPRYSAMWIRYSYGTNVDTTGSLVWGYWVKSPWVNNNNYVYGMGERVYFTNADNTVTKAGIVMQNYRSYGIEMLIGAGGNTFIGAGESVVYAPQWLSDNTVEWPHGKPAYDGPGGERMYFTSDSGFYFLSNMGSLDNNGAVRGRFICIDTNSHLYPSEDRAQQLGRSGNSWSKVWANEIGMGGTTDNSRIVWDTDGILRCFGAKAVRIGMDSVYWDVNERADLIPSSNGAQSIGRSDHIIGNMYVENVQTYQNLVLHGVSADGFDITSILNGGGDGLIRLAAYSRYYRFGLDGDGNYLDIYRESTTNSMCIFGKGGVAPIKIGKDPSRYIEIDYDGGSSVPVIRSGHNSMMLEMMGGSLIVRDSRNGKPYLPVAASAFNVNSSVRYKENIQEMTEEQALDIMRYRVLTYDYKEECGGAKDQQGLLAEDVYEINPYPVTLDEEGRPDAIDYSKFVPQLIKMVQIQQKQINNLKNEIAMQENDKNS